jgi:dolichyl-phosphate-mannose--protein O-mannosyl transferase
VLVPAAVLILAALIRLWGLGSPPHTVWDEQYYAFDAYAYLGGTADRGDTPGLVTIKYERSWEHPPLGKILIATGVGPLGFNQWAYRLPAALFGIAGVALVYALALALWESVAWAGLAALFVTLDGMHIVHSRAAMLDGFQSTFLVAGVLAFALHLKDATNRRHLVLCGTLLGAAMATKWSSGFLLGPALVIAVAMSGRDWRRVGRVVLCLIVAPAAIYIASYTEFFVQHGPAVRDFVTLQERMVSRQRANHKLNPQRSEPWQWPLLLRPIRYSPDYGDPRPPTREILELGNPALWWGFLFLGPVAAWAAVRRRSWRDAMAVAPYLLLYLPWFVIGRTRYSYYMTPCAPFVALGAVAALRHLPRPVTYAFGAAVGAVGLAFLPLWINTPLPSWADHLRWLSTWT